MKQLLLNIILVCAFGFSNAQTGIGTTSPINKFQVESVTADPANTGTSANGLLRLSGNAATHVLDFGLSSTSTFSWLQARSKSNYANPFVLSLNPIGGNVGIGTTSTLSTLTVGNAGGTIAGEITLNPSSTQYEGGQINFVKSRVGSTSNWVIDQYGTSSTDARLRIFNSLGENNGIAILENGNVGMGTSIPSVRLQVSGDIIANSIAGSSDYRYKSNIHQIDHALDKVKSLRGVYFNWNQKDFPTKDFSDQMEIGFIAQEVEKIIPEVVIKDKTIDQFRSIKYDKLVALLVEAIKEQQKQIDSLKIKFEIISKKRNRK